MIEAIRHLGYAARFVSGYLYSPWLDGGTDLIRVGVAHHASMLPPVSGSWSGLPDDYIGMDIDVQVHRRQ